MRTQFFSRNVWIGVLMGIVLAFGVLGTADALTFGTTKRGDLATERIGDDFEITFSVKLKSPTAVEPNTKKASSTDIDYAAERRTHPGDPAHPINRNYAVTVDASGFDETTDTHYYTVTTTENVSKTDSGGSDIDGTVVKTTHTRNWVSESEAYHYNDETVDITGSGARIIKVGSHRINHTLSSTPYELIETGEAATKLSSSITLTLIADAAATVEISIADGTEAADFPTPPGADNPPPELFTVYVVSPQSAVSTGSTTFASGDGVEYAYEGERRQINTYFTFSPTTNAPVHYSVEGNGRVYVWMSNSRRTNATSSLFTSSNAPVYLDTNRGTSKVTVWVSGTAARSALFIFQGASPSKFTDMEITHGDGQEGATGGRLEDYLEVKVTDGNNRALPGVAVQFRDTPTDSRFIPVSGTKVYVSSTDALVDALTDPLNAATFTATSSKPPPANTIFVQTDSSGLAKVYYQLSATGGDYQVTADLTGSPTPVSEIFRPTATTGTRKASLAIISGDRQSAAKGEPLKDPLVVIARSTAGHRIAGVNVEFETTTGLLESGTSSGQEITVATGSDGTASVTYNVGQITGARSVTAEVTDEQTTTTEYDFVIERVEFRINRGGTPTPARDPNPPPATTGSLDILVSGDGATRSVTVTSVSAAGTSTAIPVVLTGNALGGSTEFVTTGTATEITVPTEPGSYSLTATASVTGYAPTTETITVAGPTSLGTISITSIGQPTNGVQTFSISVVDTDTARISGALTVTVSGSGFTTRTVATANGSGAVDITLPTAAGTYTLTASAEGYESGTTQVRIAGTPTTPTAPTTSTPTVGEPDSIQISGQAFQTGTANTPLDLPLSVRVLDSNNAGVADVRVTFRVRTGQGRLSQRGNGRAVLRSVYILKVLPFDMRCGILHS